ncbi:MAG: YkgJ family cysteine cluster protein [Bacteroidales bacterium]|jgi:Fe-S-cluster containining protein|nr:YkgJ family cysteine cluster protein [Bacteroidales bacterium]
MHKKLNKLKPKQLDELFNNFHEKEFANFDCLTCANCCKTLGPRLSNIDIERLAKNQKIKISDFFENYLKIDEDNDVIFNNLPCPFLMDDNYCSVYKNRPKACREYPHTNQKNIKSILKLCVKNSETCPVVKNIFLKLKKI